MIRPSSKRGMWRMSDFSTGVDAISPLAFSFIIGFMSFAYALNTCYRQFPSQRRFLSPEVHSVVLKYPYFEGQRHSPGVLLHPSSKTLSFLHFYKNPICDLPEFCLNRVNALKSGLNVQSGNTVLSVPPTTTNENEYFVRSIRKDFPILKKRVNSKPYVYFDNAATSQKPRSVIEKLEDFFMGYNSNVHRGTHRLAMQATEVGIGAYSILKVVDGLTYRYESTRAYESARDEVKEFVNADRREEIIFTSGATEGINLVAHAWGDENIKVDDEIILSEAEHHSNLVPWQILAKRKGAKLRFIKITPGGWLDIEQFQSLLNEKTRLVCLFHSSNVLGNTLPMKRIIAEAHRFGAKVLVDACQSVPHKKVDVQAMDCDFLVASGHKMCGPTGIGFLYGKLNLLKAMQPWKSGGEMIQEVNFDSSTYMDPPYKFEAGTPPIAETIALGEAVKYLKSIGISKIEEYESVLARYLYDSLLSIPNTHVYGPSFENGQMRSCLASFNHLDFHSQDISAFLDFEGIAIRAGHHCAQPLHTQILKVSGSARASLYFYNTMEEIDCFIKELTNVLQTLKKLKGEI